MTFVDVSVTYRPSADTVERVATPDDLTRLLDVARGLRHLTDDRPLYEDVQLVDGTVRFTVRLDPSPTYGADNLARGIASRAVSEAKMPGDLVLDHTEG